MIPKFMETARLWFASGSRDAKPAPGATKPQTSAAAYKGQQAPDDAAGPPRTRVRDRAGAVGHPTHLLSGGRTSAARAADRSAVDVCVAHVSGSARPLSAENIEKTAGEAGVATSVAKEAGVDLPMAITGSLPADASLEALLLAAGVTNRPELARHRILQLIAAKVAQLDITPTHPPPPALTPLHRWVDAQPSGAAATWLALADALFRSSDAPVGKLRHGLLAPEGVRALIDEVAFRGLEDAPQKREALNVLPRLLVLAQERCDRDLVVHAVATMGRLAGPATAAGARESEAQAQAGVTSALSRASRYMCPQAGAHGERVWGEIAHPWRTASLPAELEGVYQRHRDPGFDAATGCADASIASSTSSSARAEPRAS